jgi:hypothetical protein
MRSSVILKDLRKVGKGRHLREIAKSEKIDLHWPEKENATTNNS